MYDFGTTTETVITFMGKIKRKPQKKAVQLLARNTPPVFQCIKCKEKAHYIDAYDETFYCNICAEEIENDDVYLLRVTNSPRMGQCGYDGEYDDFQFESVYPNSL